VSLSRRACAVALALITLAWGASAGAAQRTDVLTIVNGDEITGEIKRLARGKLSYKTDDMGTLSVKWDKVLRLRTTHIQEVVLASGRRMFGSLRDAEDEGQIVIVGDTVDVLQIVEITPIEATFFQRTSGYVDIGLTYAKANAATTFTTGWEANYRGEIWGTGLSGSNYFQEQASAEPTRRNNVGGFGERFINGRWAGVVSINLQQNDELNLALRASYGAGARARPLITNHMEIVVEAGVLLNQERFSQTDTTSTSQDDTATSLEVTGAFDWDYFRYDSPKFDFDVDFAPFFSVTKLGRVRFQLDVRTTYEVFSDFNMGLTFRDSFDSDPPSAGASNNDFTVTFTVGWSWS
jgi:hypothetical protein